MSRPAACWVSKALAPSAMKRHQPQVLLHAIRCAHLYVCNKTTPMAPSELCGVTYEPAEWSHLESAERVH